MKLKINKKNIFAIFLILQPFFDSYYLYSDEVMNIFGFSPTTIIRMIVIAIFSLLLFFDKDNKKSRLPIFLYMSVIFVYVILHHFVANSIDINLIYKSFKYNIIEELFYIIRMLLPIFTIYIVYLLNYSKDEIKKIVFYVSLSIASIIIILNLFELSLRSYGKGIILGNIFDWLSSDIERTALASKGWFNSANQISGLILLLMPIMLFSTLEEKKKSYLFVLIMLILSSFMIGTRVSTMGLYLIVVCLIIAYFVFKKIKKISISRNDISYAMVIVIFMALSFNYSPIANCSGNNYLCVFHLESESAKKNAVNAEEYKNLVFTGNVCNFLKKTPTSNIYYEKLYPCEDNVEFWTNYSKNKTYLYINNRLMEKMVTNDVYSKIDNINTNLFGMGRSRFLSAEIYYEKDIVVHTYTIGIIGIILFIVIPYIYPCLYIFITKFKYKKLELFDIFLISSVASVILASFLSGHLLDELIVTLYLGFVVGILLRNNNNSDNIIDKVLIVNDERVTGGVSILLEDILNHIDKNIKIDLLILHDNGTRLNNLPDNVNLIFGTKFFNVIDIPLKEIIANCHPLLLLKKLYLIFLMKTGLIEYKIVRERNKILNGSYKKEVAFKDGFCGLFVVFGSSKEKIQWLHSDYSISDYLANYKNLFIRQFNNFDKIIAVSNPVKNSFNNIYGQSSKTSVIYNLIDTKRIISLSKEKDEELSGKFNLISIGRLHHDKGFQRVIKILKKLNAENLLEDVCYTIIGEGSYKDELINLIEKEKLQDKVKLIGKKENPYPSLKQADLLILSSLHESFGLVVVESLTLGVPVLSVRVASIESLLQKKHGLIVDNDDVSLYNGLKMLLLNKEKIDDYKRNLKSYKYDNDFIIKEINELLGDTSHEENKG